MSIPHSDFERLKADPQTNNLFTDCKACEAVMIKLFNHLYTQNMRKISPTIDIKRIICYSLYEISLTFFERSLYNEAN